MKTRLVLAILAANLGLAAPIASTLAEPAVPMALSVSLLTGEVTVVDPKTRMMTIKTPDGTYQVLHIPEGVTGLDKIDIGDKVTITSTETVLVEIEKIIGNAPVGVVAQREVIPGPEGKPEAKVVDKVASYGKISKIDKDRSMVTVESPEGTLELRVEDPALLDGLTPGDAVVARYERVVNGNIEL
ncbi:MAG: copper-binding protein [Chromatiaceae bacterium]